MGDREDIMKALQAGIRTWTIGPDGISADGEEDTNNLLRVLEAHPHLAQAFAPQSDPEADAIKELMLSIISRNAEARDTAQGEAKPASPLVSALPPNPIRMSEAKEQYVAACRAEGLAPRYVLEKERLLDQLATHVASSLQCADADPFVHDIGAHHLSTFLDGKATKSSTDGSNTNEASAPRTLLKKITNLRTFFEWAREERGATLIDPVAGLGKRDKALRKAAAKSKDSYHPFTNEQVMRIFEPSRYLAFNNRADYFWAPLLGLHLGTRLKEVVTLELEHIGLHEATGLWFMDVRPENAKNENSIRRLPIPTRLVELGFIRYVERLRTIGATHLFPHRDLTQDSVALDPSGNCSDRFAKYLDTLGISDRSLVFHSFRHTVVTALQDVGTPLSDSMQITGHQAQEHAIATGKLTAEQAQSVHVKVYTHADKARLSTEFPLARIHGWLDRAIQVPLDYPRLSRAAAIVTDHVVKTASGFKSGWSPLNRARVEEAESRLNGN